MQTDVTPKSSSFSNDSMSRSVIPFKSQQIVKNDKF